MMTPIQEANQMSDSARTAILKAKREAATKQIKALTEKLIEHQTGVRQTKEEIEQVISLFEVTAQDIKDA